MEFAKVKKASWKFKWEEEIAEEIILEIEKSKQLPDVQQQEAMEDVEIS